MLFSNLFSYSVANLFLIAMNDFRVQRTFCINFSFIIYTNMPSGIATEKTILATGFAGAFASIITQPLEVLKTNKINSPATYYKDIHRKIVQKGMKQYMKGASIAGFRQAFGFTIYTQILQKLDHFISTRLSINNKYFKYSVSSVLAKLTAMIVQAPFTLLKTRLEIVGSSSITSEIKYLCKNPRQSMKGLGTSIARQSFYTLFHYNTYRYFKDEICKKTYNSDQTFLPAFIAGIVAITISQPLEVIRSKISLNLSNESVSAIIKNHTKTFGLRGYFIGYLPRLLRKPINSGLCWTVVQYYKNSVQ